MEWLERSGPSLDCSLPQGCAARRRACPSHESRWFQPADIGDAAAYCNEEPARQCAEASSRELQPSPLSPSPRNQAAIPENLTVQPSTEPRTATPKLVCITEAAGPDGARRDRDRGSSWLAVPPPRLR